MIHPPLAFQHIRHGAMNTKMNTKQLNHQESEQATEAPDRKPFVRPEIRRETDLIDGTGEQTIMMHSS
jgi:hypothetical protein